ncbi:hypothetical protein FF1_008966 [Malus domestica]
MGREIVRGENEEKGKRSELWLCTDTLCLPPKSAMGLAGKPGIYFTYEIGGRSILQVSSRANQLDKRRLLVKVDPERDEGLVLTTASDLREPFVENNALARKKLGQFDFNRLSVYNSCFPSDIDLEWFGHQSNDYSRTISLPQNLNMDSNWLGLAVCANFAILEHLTSEIEKLDIPAISHNLSCHFESDKVNSLHHYCTSKEEFMRLHLGGFVWVSYIPRVWFSDQLNECSSLEASVVSDHEAFSVHGCGLRLLHQHDEKEFTQAILQYMTSLCDKKGKISKHPHKGETGMIM